MYWMATYKVIQDIEAEDKLIGPLTLRQFLYASIVVVVGIVMFMLSKTHVLLAVPFLPVLVFFGLLAAPFGKDQPSEVWLLAKIRFALKPRKRIWDQSGMSQLVTITAPKKQERPLTDGLSQREVKSRLHALADVIDSRGWATKNATVSAFVSPSYVAASDNLLNDSDRLVSASALPREVPSVLVDVGDDIFDDRNNPRAQQLTQMISEAEINHHKQAVAIAQGQPSNEQAQDRAPGQAHDSHANDYWFLGENSSTVKGNAPTYIVEPSSPEGAGLSLPRVATATQTASSMDEQQLLSQIHANDASVSAWKSHMKTILPPEEQHRKDLQEKAEANLRAREEANRQAAAAQERARVEQIKRMTPSSNPDRLVLARNNDLNVATIARQSHRSNNDDGEVVVNLH